MNTTTTTARANRHGHTTRSVIAAGIASAAVLTGMAFTIDTLSSDSHNPNSETVTSGRALQPNLNAP